VRLAQLLTFGGEFQDFVPSPCEPAVDAKRGQSIDCGRDSPAFSAVVNDALQWLATVSNAVDVDAGDADPRDLNGVVLIAQSEQSL
jgi:hypothetical protein